MGSSDGPDVLRRPGYDHRWWIGLAPCLVVFVALAWSSSTSALTSLESVMLYVLISVAFVPAMVVSAYAIDDAKRGYRYTREPEGLLFMFVPWALSIALLLLARLLTFVDGSQFATALGLVVFASLPALLYGAAKNHRNRKLPYRNPRGASSI